MNAQSAQCLAHTQTQIAAPDARQSNLRSDYIRTLNPGHRASFIYRLAYGRGRIAYPDSQRVRWACHAFAQFAMPHIHDDGARLCASAVNSQHKFAAMNLSGGHYIRYLRLRFHYYLKALFSMWQTAIATNFGINYSRPYLIIETKRFYPRDNHF
jgi:hypothetical protein